LVKRRFDPSGTCGTPVVLFVERSPGVYRKLAMPISLVCGPFAAFQSPSAAPKLLFSLYSPWVTRPAVHM
jgi:hypothetical protein